MSLFEYLKKLDKVFFVLIHNDADHLVFDNIMLILRNPNTWIPLYVFLLFYIIKKAGNRAWLFILFSVITFAVTDSVSASILKPFFARARPCYDAEIHNFVRNLIDCGGVYSFPSSHAANHFGLAAFWFWSLWKITGKKWQWLWVWASVIGYAQVYVGKHYPFDIVAGALLGWIIGICMAKIFEFFWNADIKLHNIIHPVFKKEG
jgi:membrane-associated phospholipid phosphatase